MIYMVKFGSFELVLESDHDEFGITFLSILFLIQLSFLLNDFLNLHQQIKVNLILPSFVALSFMILSATHFTSTYKLGIILTVHLAFCEICKAEKHVCCFQGLES